MAKLVARNLHGPQILQSNGKTLDQNSQADDMKSCYLCHPGPVTQCKRGAMNKVLCAPAMFSFGHAACGAALATTNRRSPAC